MFKGRDGTDCTAKTIFVATWAIVMVKVLLSGTKFGPVEFLEVDFIGLTAVLTSTAGIYGYRSKVKADEFQ